MTVSFYTLGCKVNQYETQAMLESFQNRGFTVKDFSDVCDVYVINSCTVTAVSDQKSRKAARRAKATNPDAVVILTGCYSQTNPKSAAKIEGVDILTGTSDRLATVDLLYEFLCGREKIVRVEPLSDVRQFEDMHITGFHEHTRANVKIEDGCDNFCAYCIVPYARGRVRSKPVRAALDEISSLLDNGFYEIVLSGININSYGKDIGSSLLELILAIDELKRPMRLRLGSLEPTLLSDDFLIAVKNTHVFCPHFHISLQSGCDATLKAMDRRYTKTDFLNCVGRIRQHFPDAAVTADVIVGFPGETHEDFLESKRTVDDARLKFTHIFPYSKRAGTKAALMENQVDAQTKRDRAKELKKLCDKNARAFHSAFTGRQMPVLFEAKVGENTYEGLSANYIAVRALSFDDIRQRLLDVRLKKAHDHFMKGEII